MTKLTKEELLLVEEAREAFKKVREGGAEIRSEAFLNKCSSESGADYNPPPRNDYGTKKPNKEKSISFLLRSLLDSTKMKM